MDADPDNLPRVLKDLRRRNDKARYEELAVAMTVLADADCRGRGLRAVLAAHLPEELVMQSWVYKQGHEKGHEKGHKEGHEEGRREGLREGLLRVLVARAIPLSDAQRAVIAAEADPEVLARWHERALTARSPEDLFRGP
ncbi:MAG: hypothetical protein HY909_20735 [Deltaproteobacteria bacterium]|nr:hypothetical protein [Deltaproteobacteria bacterium]